MDNTYKGLLADVLNVKYYENEPLKEHCSFKIGGACPLFVEIDSIFTIQQIIAKLNEKNLKFMILGNGSNVLFPDEGIDEVVLHFGADFNKVSISGDEIYAEAGVSLASLANTAQKAELSGLEFASGIPGTLGGAVLMNAGAYGGEMSQVIKSVIAIDRLGNKLELDNPQMNFGYRQSRAMTDGLIVLGAYIKLKPGDKAEILKCQQDLNKRRSEKQPLNFPSAGSFFKRPSGNFAGALIEDCKLKGFRIGDAQVSELHAGFIINVGTATYKDVVSLMEHVQKAVFDKHGIMLNPEVRIIKGRNK